LMAALSFDHLVGARQQRRWHVQAERLGGLEIDHEFVLRRRLNRKVGRLLALEDAVDVTGCLPELVDRIRSVGDQTTGGDVMAGPEDCGESMPGRKRDDQLAMSEHRGTRRDDYAAIPRLHESIDGMLDLLGLARVDRRYIHAKGCRRRLD